MQAKVIRQLSRLHKALGLIVGLQLLFWTVSGFYFTLFPIEAIHGDHLRKEINDGSFDPQSIKVSIEHVSVIYSGEIESASLEMFLGKPIWRVTGDGHPAMIDATSGRPIIVDESFVRNMLSKASTIKHVDQLKIRLIKKSPPREFAGQLPAYQAIDPQTGARFYIPVDTGTIRSIRTNAWRTFDILWRFHIQDVTGADRFDSWWLKLFAGSAILFTLTGMGLLLHRWKVRRLFS